MIADLRRRLISILGGDEKCSDAQLIEHARAVRRQRDTYRDLYNALPARTTIWDEVKLGQMVVAERGPDAGLAVWMIAGRQSALGSDELKLLFVRIVEPAEVPEILWMVKHRVDTVMVLDLPGVGDGTAALGELGA